VRNQLRAVEGLLRKWDPIGALVNEPSPPDEYDTYAPLVLKQLQSGADVERLAQHLTEITTAEIGIGANVEHDRKYAEQLVAWWREQGNAA
jgi:hypothetical protein